MNVKIPPFPGVISLGFLVGAVNSESVKMCLVFLIYFDERIICSAPKIKLGNCDTAFYGVFGKREKVAFGACEIVWLAKVEAPVSTPFIKMVFTEMEYIKST